MPATEASTNVTVSAEAFARRAGPLYSLPAVAVEVLELTSHAKVDVAALKECIERDPALTSKVLRVVNSSIYGLSRPAGALHEALALLGTKQLKMLVLGFSLPEKLFLDVAAEQLDWYWNSTLARAVAAREISEQLFRQPGDDAFLAGLLEDLGILVLLRELGAPYATLLSDVMERKANLRVLERSGLGFDHVDLTVELLVEWRMPKLLIQAIREPKDRKWLAKNRAEHAHLARVMHLAGLVAELVGQHRLNVMPDLMEAGAAYCELDKPRLTELVAALEPKVRQLAKAMAVSASHVADYTQAVVRAHEQMATLSEGFISVERMPGRAADGAAAEPAVCEETPRNKSDLLRAMDEFLNWSTAVPTVRTRAAAPPEGAIADAALQKYVSSLSRQYDFSRPEFIRFANRLTLSVGQCRSARQPLCVVTLGLEPTGVGGARSELAERVLDRSCQELMAGSTLESLAAPGRRVLALLGYDRSEAVALARKAVERMRRLMEPLSLTGELKPHAAAAGVASVCAPAKNFRPLGLLETAERCLAAALASGGVKSLEVN